MNESERREHKHTRGIIKRGVKAGLDADFDAEAWWAALPPSLRHVVAHDWQHFAEFFVRYAIGSKVEPSCLVCGCLPSTRGGVAIHHAEIADAVVCLECRDAASNAPAPVAVRTAADAREGAAAEVETALLAGLRAVEDSQMEDGLPADTASAVVATIQAGHAALSRLLGREHRPWPLAPLPPSGPGPALGAEGTTAEARAERNAVEQEVETLRQSWREALARGIRQGFLGWHKNGALIVLIEPELAHQLTGEAWEPNARATE